MKNKIKFEVLKSFIGDDTQSLNHALGIMVDELSASIELLQSAYLVDDLSTIAFHLHKIISSLGYLGCELLVADIRQIRHGIEGDIYNHKTKQDVKNVLQELENIRDELITILNQ